MKSKRKRKKEREREFFIVDTSHHGRERMNSVASPSMFSDKLILLLSFQCLEMSCQCVNIVQGDGNAVFSHVAILVHSKLARESFRP